MPKQTEKQKEVIGRVMHEFKHGELETSAGRKVKNPKQAIAIGMHEAGASKYESKEENKRNLEHTKEKERKGKTAKQQKEGKK
jgi:hypothetical protein